jgi:hypothetical protein
VATAGRPLRCVVPTWETSGVQRALGGGQGALLLPPRAVIAGGHAGAHCTRGGGHGAVLRPPRAVIAWGHAGAHRALAGGRGAVPPRGEAHSQQQKCPRWELVRGAIDPAGLGGRAGAATRPRCAEADGLA